MRERLNRHRDGEVRLSRARRADAEDYVVRLYGLDVAALVGGLGRDLFFSGGVEARFGEVVSERIGAVFGYLREGLAQLAVGEVLALSEERGEVFDDALGCGNVCRVAVERQVLAARVNAHVEE